MESCGQCNCAQAVMKAFEDKIPVDADTLMKLGAGHTGHQGQVWQECHPESQRL